MNEYSDAIWCLPLLISKSRTHIHTTTITGTTVHNNNYRKFIHDTDTLACNQKSFKETDIFKPKKKVSRQFHNAVWGIGRTNSELAVLLMDLF